jgi:hypothetical protein
MVYCFGIAVTYDDANRASPTEGGISFSILQLLSSKKKL